MADNKPDSSLQRWNYATQALCIIFMAIFFFMRVYTRIAIHNGFGREDWACFGAWFLGVGYSVIALTMGRFGGGLHMDDVPPEDIIPFKKTVYVTMVMYGPTAFLTKLSILWIMTRVFRPYRKVVIFIYVFLGLMLAYYIPAVIVKIRICNPISLFWDSESSAGGSCLNQPAIIMADAVVSVVSDLIVLILPLPLTLSLQMHWKRKLRVMLILCAGGLAVASSIVRLVLIAVIGQSKDMTVAFTKISMFGNAEIAIGVICACLPALSVLTKKYHENSSKRTPNYGSEYGLQDTKSWSRKSRNDRSRNGTITKITGYDGSDEDVLVSNAQANPKVETSVNANSAMDRRQEEDSIGITKTVDVSTSVASMK